MKKTEINQLIVMNHKTSATMFRVKEIDGFRLGVIDATLEDKEPNQALQWVDVSSALNPNRAQLEEWDALQAAREHEKNLPIRAKVNRLFSEMPYGGVCHFRMLNWDDPDDEKRLELIAHNLQAMKEILQYQCEESRKKDERLARYRRIVDGFALLAEEIKARAQD